jgi:transposase
VRLVIKVARKVKARCARCLITITAHEHLSTRRWADLPLLGHPVVLEYAPVRGKCKRKSCGFRGVELLPWAGPHQRQTRRLQQRLALEAASMPVSHVAWSYDLSWATVRRAEEAALHRWQQQREPVPLHKVGIDEKWLGRRHRRPDKFVTIVSNLETGEPVWIGFGRSEATLSQWIAGLTAEQKRAIKVFAMDMHRPFRNALAADPILKLVSIVHDPFHVMKRAGEALSDLRRSIFFRAGAQMRRIGRGSRWLVLRSWERCSEADQAKLRYLFSFNPRLGRAYQAVDELRHALRSAPDAPALRKALWRTIKRTSRYDSPMRGLCDCLRTHFHSIAALAQHRPPTGRIEALNNNWETLVRRSRGYRDLHYLLLKLRFATANPIRRRSDLRRFLALGMLVPRAHA